MMLVKDSLAYFLARLIPAILSISIIALFTRLLPTAEYGKYALILSAVTILNAIFFSWNVQSIFRFYENEKSQRSALLSSGFLGFLISYFLVCLVGTGIYVFQDLSISLGLVVSGFLFLLAFAWLDLNAFLINLDRQPFVYTLLQSGKSVLTLLVGGAAAYYYKSASIVILSMAISHLIFSFVISTCRAWLKYLAFEQIRINLIKRALSYGLPLSVSISLMGLIANLDRIMLGYYQGMEAVGAYTVSFDIVQFTVGMLGSTLSLSFYPLIIKTFEENGAEATQEIIKRYSIIQFSILVPAISGLALTSPSLARIVIGAELSDTASVLMPWLCLSVFFSVMKSFYADFSFQLARWTKGAALIGGVAVVLNVCLNMFFIPLYAAMGAAIASIITFGVAFFLSIFLGMKRGFRLPLITIEHIKILIAAAGMAFLVILLDGAPSVFLLMQQVGLGLLSYALFFFMLDIMNSRKLMLSAISKYRNNL